MPAKRKPAYLLHQATGQARVRIEGKDFYLGPHGSQKSRDLYDDLVSEWLVRQDLGRTNLTIDELSLLYLAHAEQYYQKAGEMTAEVACVRSALRHLVRLSGPTRAREFTPVKLREVRHAMVEAGLCRTTINQQIGRLRRAFRWAVSEDLIPVTTYAALSTLPGLRRGKTAAREPEPVRPVSDAVIDRTLPHLPRVVADMVRFQRLTGARPGEVCQLRPCDIDRTAQPWVFRPESHKTEHHGKERRIYIGPRAQAVVAPYLERPAESHCFSPAESEEGRRAERHAQRRTPANVGNRPGSNRRIKPRRQPQRCYSNDSYRRAVARACEIAEGMPEELQKIPQDATKAEKARIRKEAAIWRAKHCWSPNQLRHTAATQIRQQFGLEAAQATLGHSAADVTQIYAERDFSLAASVARQVG